MARDKFFLGSLLFARTERGDKLTALRASIATDSTVVQHLNTIRSLRCEATVVFEDDISGSYVVLFYFSNFTTMAGNWLLEVDLTWKGDE